MDYMCNDLLLEIFSYLTMKERTTCSQVSHRWRDLFQYSPIFSLKICRRLNQIEQLQSEFHNYHKFNCNNHLHNFNNLNIIYYDNVNQLNLIIKNLLPQLKRLKAVHFEINSFYELFETDLDCLMDLDLEHFEVIYTCNNMNIEGKFEKLLPKLPKLLKHLIVEPKLFSASPFVCSTKIKNQKSTSYFGNVGLNSISRYLPNLEQLKYQPLSFLIESLHPIRLPTKLKSLSLPKVRMNMNELHNFNQLNHANLTELNFFDVNIPVLRIICNMQNLKKLVLGKIRITQSDDLLLLRNLKNLEYLQFELTYKNIDLVLSELMQQLTKIRHLCLINCNLSNSTIKDIINFWPKLEYLELHNDRHNQNINDEVLEYFIGLDTLRSLALPYANFTNKNLCNYIERSKIEKLDVSGCMNITEDVIHKMVNKSTKNPKIKYYLTILGPKFTLKENLSKNISVVLD